MDNILKYVTENALILIPVLYILGAMLKSLQTVEDRYIPFILLVFGILFSIAMLGFNVDSVIQGFLVTGVTVYTNQLFKQINKGE